MSFQKLLTNLKFTTTEWIEFVRYAMRERDNFRAALPHFDQLESRVLYSASPMPVDMAAAADADQASDAAAATPDASQSDSQQSAEIRTADDSLALLDELTDELMPALESVQQRTHELVFVDQSAADYEQLLADFESERDDGRVFEVFVLDSSSNGLAQITEVLSERQDINALHLVSHGTDRALKLGNLWLTTDSLETYRSVLSGWSHALSDDADLLFYGCDLAGGEDGRAILAAFAELTGADVAASGDDTGAAELGGDWELEYTLGDMEASLAFSQIVQADWHGLLNTFVVTNINDSGAGSLRQAILDANALGGADTITFNIAGTGVHTISVGSSLTITDAVTIDATTDDSFAANSNRPAIILDGNNNFTGDGFVLTSTADGTTIRGFVIRDFTGNGIEIQANSNGNTIAGNYIGRMTASGTDAGTAETNSGYGIHVLAANNTIGGTTTADRNVISGNTSYGIYITGASATGNVVAGNYIGLLADGSTALANDEGVHIYNGASSNTVGGATTAHRNIISGNTNDGVQIWTSANNNIVQNNYLGTDVTGTLDRGNGDDGIDVDFTSTGNQILSNLISGNNAEGIDMVDGGANSTTIQGNLIGTQANGTSALGNTSYGIVVGGTTNTVTIGGTTYGQGNTIAFNGADGVYVAAGTSVSIRGNSIHSNTGMGIDLGADGVLNNDSNDGDSGANNLQNFPDLTSVVVDGSQVFIAGSLNSESNKTYRIEFFANSANDREGQRFLGFTTVTTPVLSPYTVSFTATLNASVAAGEYVTATATDPTNNTSEFGLQRQAFSGMGIWANNSTTPEFAQWNGSGFGTTSNTTNLSEWAITQVAEAPTRTEVINVGINVDGRISGQIWNGSTWSAFSFNEIVDLTTGGSPYRSFQLAYEQQSGDAMLVWDNGTTGTASLSYRIWNGTSWSAAQTITTPVAGEAMQLRLAADPNSDSMILAVGGTPAANDYALVWNGSSWGNAVTLDTASGADRTEIHVAYESHSGHAIVVYDADGSTNAINYHIWDGTAWGSQLSLSAPAGIGASSDANYSIMASDPNSDRIALAVVTDSSEIWISVWNGSAWGSQVAATTSAAITTAPVVGLAFEHDSGDLLAAYGKSGNDNVFYRTWTSGGGWSGETTGPNIGNTSNTVVLYADPNSNQIMLGTHNTSQQVNFTRWTGSAWNAVSGDMTSDTGTSGGYEPLAFVWYDNNRTPVINPAAFSTPENSTAVGTVTATDADGDSLVYSISGGADAARFTIDANTGVLSFVSAPDFESPADSGGNNVYDVIIKTSDQTGGTDSVAIAVTVTGVNEAPTFVIGVGDGVVTTPIGSSSDNARSVTVQPDGKILVAGYSSNGTDNDFTLTRYNADGTLDTSFSGDGKLTYGFGFGHDEAYSVTVQSDGKILIAGTSSTGTASVFTLLRYNSNGTLDTTFDTDGIVTTAVGANNSDLARSVVVQSDGKIVVAGYSSNGSNNDFAVVRYNANGSLDTSFSGDGKLTTTIGTSHDEAYSVAIQSDGKILVAGTSYNGTNYDFALVRYNTNGTLDTTFSGDGKLTTAIGSGTDRGFSVTVQSDGKILVAGDSDNGGNNDFALVRYSSDGSLDTTFDTDGKLTTAIGSGFDAGQSVTVQTDGKILVAGYGSNGTNQDFALVRYNSNGSLDTSFSGDGKLLTAVGSGNDYGYSVTVQADGKILLVGNSHNGSNDDFALVRYDSNGSHDASFDAVVVNTLDGAPAYTENGTAVVLDSNVQVFDAELSALNNFSGATLTLARNGGANTQDAYSATGTLSALTQGAALVVGGTTIGTVTTNSGGTLLLTFNANATNALVNSAMQQIAYSNSSDAPAATAQIIWTFNDNNSGSQGTGGPLSITGSVTVNITATNDAPTLGDGTLASVAEDTANPAGQTVSTIFAGQFADVDAGSSFGGIAVVGNTANTGTQGTWQYSTNGGTNWFAIGSVTDGATALAISSSTLIRFLPVADYSGTPPALVVRGLDNTYAGGWSTTAGTESHVTVNTTTNGGTTAIAAATANLSTSVTAVNDPPVITSQGGGVSASVSVAENITTVTTVTSSDVDGGTPIYSISGGADAAMFAINSSTGALTFVSAPNREAPTDNGGNNVYDVQVQVSDGAGGTDTQDMAVTVNDEDEFDVGAVSDTNAAANAVNENAANGTTVGITGLGADADATTNTITYSLDDNAGGRFAINGSTGVVTVANGTLLNREAAASHNITIRATSSDTSFSTAVFTINLNDIDEFDVGAVSDTNVAANAVNENAANGTTVGVIGFGSDADATTNTITYSLDDNAGGRFAINSSNGVITVADGTLLNREAAASHNITIRATSSDTSFSTAVFTINLNDVDEFDVGAVSDSNAAANAVNENAANGTTVGVTGFGSDADATNNTLTYSLDDNAGGRFAINSSTGVVTVADGTLLNREAAASHNITIRATSSDTSFSTAVFTINLNDVDEFDVGAVSDGNAVANAVNENAANGTTVGISGFGSDADATTNTITYSLDDNAGGRFAINSSTGVVTVADGTLLNREAAASHNITVRATSSDTSFSTAVFTINLNDMDEFDVGAVSDSNAAANAVNENAANGTTVGVTGFGSDADATTNTITYSLDDNAGGRFAINSSTGVVTVADGTLLNREAAASHNITIRATSSDTSYSTALFTINLNDIDEFDVGAVSDTNAAANAVNENAANGTTVGITGFGSDADATTNTITYSLDDNAGGRFAINGSTGVVTVADGTLLNREAAASHNITIRATSSDTSFSTAVFTINLNDVDEFDVGAASDTNASANSVAENAANGTTVGITGFGSDADATNNTLTYSLDDSPGGRFAINSSTGVVTVADGTLLNREAAAAHNITIRATSGDTSFSTAVFTINLNDVDEFDVGAVSDTNAAANAVNENAANGTTVGLTALASDADATTNTITYALFNNDGGRFAIDANTGVVTVNGAIDRETDGASRSITVRATSADGSFTDQAFTINIADVDEFDTGAVTDSNAAANAVAENATLGTVVGLTAAATDSDATNNAMAYTLDNSAGGLFAIDVNTGSVTVAAALDFETAASHNIIVRATSADGSFSTQAFTISVTNVDEGGVSAVSDSNAAANTILENAANGTSVGITGLATDPDGTDVVTYSLDDNAGGRFAINSTTGLVTVADGTLLNREAAASHSITIRATSSDTSYSTAVFTINLNDVDEFDAGAVSDTNAAANAVNENAANGTTVGVTGFGSDADATNNTITYSLDDNAGGRFAINSSTGVVTVADGTLLNREAAAAHNITIRATSSDTSFSTAVFTINLNDVDEFDVVAVSDTNAAANAVNENAANGTTVGVTGFGSDADATTNTIAYSLDDNAGGRFAINSSTGVVTVADGTLLNREAAASHNITIRATSSDTSFSTAVFTINLNDVDEFDVGAVSDSNAAANAVNENAANGTTVGVTGFGADADATTNTITYSLDDNAGGRFAINSATGVVTVADGTLLNREAAAAHNITIRATSSDASSSTAVFTINLNDVDEFDVGAVSDSNAVANAVNENATAGTTVGLTASASDADATANAITYSLDDSAGGRFAIHSSTGVVTVAGTLDREAAASYSITVRATSADTSFSTQAFTINVNDVDEFDVTTLSDSNATVNAVAENAANGTTVGVTASTSDADATTNSITYSLDDSAGGRFAIHSSTGVVTVAGAINREVASSYNLTVRATSADAGFSTQAFPIAINDVDEFDVGAIADTDATGDTVSEAASVGAVVGVTALATDGDATDTVSYSLDNDAGGSFAIQAASGLVTVAPALDYETNTSHTLTVRATSSDGSFSTVNLTINVTDANESAVGAISDSDLGPDTVAENAAVSSVVGITALATDPDLTDTVSYSLDDSAGGRFAINSSTGVVTVAGAIDREAAAIYAIIVRATSSDTSFNTRSFTIAITDVDEFDVGATTDSNATANAVDENAANGTLVGLTALASDADATNHTLTYTLDDNAGGRFAIDGSTGVVTVANGTLLNREAAASHNITVRATSSDSSFSTAVFTINLNDVDEFDVGAVSDSNATANAVNENAANGTVVGVTASASDADVTTNTITYSLDDSAGGRFAINGSTGVVTVANGTLLNREAAASHNIVVRATSSDSSFSTAAFTINLNDVDEFDTTTVVDANVATDSVAENASVGAAVGITALASDADATTNAITYTLDSSAGGLFAIVGTTGVVTVNAALDFETATSHNIIVRATSADGSSSTQGFTINLTDVNEGAVSAISDSNLAANTVLENAANGTTVGITGLATDPDGTDVVTYSLDDNAGGRFAIHATTGVVTVSGAIDREAAASYNITIRATSSDTSTTSQTYTINLGDVDEFNTGAVSDSNVTANAVNENAANGTVVGVTASATDADATTNSMTYSLQDSDSGNFAIDATTGVVTVAAASNRETLGASRSITVRATSADGSFTDQVFTIALNDVDEFDVTAPTDANAAINQVDENVSIGTLVGITAAASDADATTNTVAYSLFDSDGGRFAIDANTGVVTVTGTLNRETLGASRNITVRATSADGSTADTVFTINLNDVDEFDTSAVVDANAAIDSVAENASVGTAVGITALASDADAASNAITYTLDSSAGGLFAIDGTTGVVTVNAALDFETATSHNILVRATSADGSSSTQGFTINLTDVNEGAVSAVSDSNLAANTVLENAANGTSVGITGLATDPDGTDVVTYSLDDDAGGRFAIHATTGVVTVSGAIDREAAASYNITIRATSSDTSTTSQTYTINLGDVDEFNTGAVSDSNATANAVNENAANGTVVGVAASAMDADATTNSMTYSLDDSAGGRFAINGSTGVVTVANGTLLNREAATSHNIVVRATSSDSSFSTAAFTVNLNDIDEFDTTTVVDANAAADSVAENASVGTAMGITAVASDADATTNAITYTLDNSAGGLFTIDGTTGVVTVNAALDFETATSHNIIVRATSADGSFSTQSFTIAVTDVNESGITAISDGDAASDFVLENASNGTVVGVTAFADDPDGGDVVTYALDDTAGGRFAIDSNTGVVTVAAGLDRELAGAYNITVRATSTDSTTTTRVFTLAIGDVDEFDTGAVTDTNATADAVNENASIGTSVGITASAVDADATTNSMTYSLQDSDGGNFAIDATTGVVTVAAALNRETLGASRNITVRATSADGSLTDQVFTIALTDVDEFDVTAPTDANAAINQVDENVASGTLVGITAAASDSDATNNAVAYSLFDSDGGRFAIDANTGVVTVAGALNRETLGASRNITVRATSADGSTADTVFTINLNDVDEFDASAVVDANAATDSVAENASVGTAVGITALASDADATNNAITYTLDSSGGGLFAIDGTTGVVTVNAALDFETATSHNIIVRATSADGSSSTQGFTINLTDVNEGAVSAVSDSNLAANTVLENAANGTTVGITGLATDPDGTDVVTYSLDDNAGGRFAIHATTGVVTVSGAIDREAAASYNVTIRATSSDSSFSTAVFTINLNDVDEFDTTAVVDANAAADSVAENASVGTAVGVSAVASDADATTNAITYTLDNSAGGLFAIDGTTGVVTVNAALDFETATSHNIVVRATSADGSFSTQSFTIAVTDVNESGITAISDANAASDFVLENASNGTLVGVTAFADDPDGSDVVTYALDDTAGGRFSIDGNTGLVTVATAIDRELAGAYNITVRATSTDSTSTTRVFTIAIGDVDEFDTGAVNDTDATADAVNENASIGNVVGIAASAADADATTNSMTYSLQDSDGDNFAIDATTGVVTVAAALNRETLGASRNITVRATSADGSFTDQIFTIALNDVDEFDVTAPTDANAVINHVDENVSIGTLVGITAAASDADATSNAITYTLDNSAGGLFAIDGTTGVVTVNAALDFETATSHNILVRATSVDGSFSTQSFTIAVTDVNESGITAISDANAASDFVLENASNGTLVGVAAFADDPDGSDAVTYALDDTAGGRFSIDGNTGLVTVAAGIDRELAGAYNITVRATSTDSTSTTRVFTIAIGDVDEFDTGVVTDTNATANAVNENATIGTSVGITASAADADAATNSMTYSLQDSDGGSFAIDATTGVVTVATALNRETLGASRSITVRATSADGSFTDQIFTIALNDVDEFDVTAPTDANAAINQVDENVSIGTLVGITAAASDADATTNAVTYSLFDSDGGRFAIDANTGVVTVAGTLNRETLGASRNITVRATSADGSTADTVFTINLNDVDEFDTTAVVDANAATDSVAENASVGTAVGITALASDADATTNAITYTLDNSAGGLFAIDGTTGVVTVNATLDFETATSHNITVRATSADGSFTDQIFTIALNDIDEFDVTVPVDTDATADAVDEHAATGSVVGITAAASDFDATTNALFYSLDDDAEGRFAIDSTTGVVTLANNTLLNFESSTTHHITVRASSTDGSFQTRVFTIAVGDSNDAPQGGSNGKFQVALLSTVSFEASGLLANAFDEDGDALTAVVIVGAQHGALTVNADGSFVYTPNEGFSGTDQFQFAASDGTALSAPVTVELSVELAIASPPPSSSGSGSSGNNDHNTGNGGSESTVGEETVEPTVETAITQPSTLPLAEAGTTDSPSTANSAAIGFFPLPSQNSSIFQAGTTEQPQDASESFFVVATLENAARTAARKIGDSVVRPITYTPFGLIADTVLTLADDRHHLQEGEFAWQKEFKTRQLIVGSSAVVMTGLSVGYAVWLLRGGALMASFLTSIPAWCSFDPLPIVESFEDAHRDHRRTAEEESLTEIASRETTTNAPLRTEA